MGQLQCVLASALCEMGSSPSRSPSLSLSLSMRAHTSGFHCADSSGVILKKRLSLNASPTTTRQDLMATGILAISRKRFKMVVSTLYLSAQDAADEELTFAA